MCAVYASLEQARRSLSGLIARQYASAITGVPLFATGIGMVILDEPLAAAFTGVSGLYLLTCAMSLIDDRIEAKNDISRLERIASEDLKPTVGVPRATHTPHPRASERVQAPLARRYDPS